MTARLRRVRLEHYDPPTARQARRPWWQTGLELLFLGLFFGSWWIIPNLWALIHGK